MSPAMGVPHETTIRVYYEDTDFSGFVYHAGYLRFLERGRTECLRSLGLTQSSLHRDGLTFVVRRIAVDYLRPAAMDDVLRVVTAIAEVRGASLRMEQHVERAGELLVRATVGVAAVRHGRATRLPLAVRQALGV